MGNVIGLTITTESPISRHRSSSHPDVLHWDGDRRSDELLVQLMVVRNTTFDEVPSQSPLALPARNADNYNDSAVGGRTPDGQRKRPAKTDRTATEENLLQRSDHPSQRLNHHSSVDGAPVPAERTIGKGKRKKRASSSDNFHATGETAQAECMDCDSVAEERRKCGDHFITLDKNYNFAFIGNPRAGKSRLINTLRGMKKTQAGAAGGSLKEPLRSIQKYHFPDVEPQLSHVVLWELPYPNDKNYEKFFTENSMDAFNMVFIMISGTVREEDIYFAKAANGKVPLCFLTSLCDQDMLADCDERKITVTQSIRRKYKLDGHRYFNDEIAKYAPELMSVKMYLISAPVIAGIIAKTNKNAELKLEEEELLDYVSSKIKIRENSRRQQIAAATWT